MHHAYSLVCPVETGKRVGCLLFVTMLHNGQPVTKCDWVQYKERYLALSLSVFDSVKSTRKPDKFSIYMQKYRLIEHFFVIENN